MGHSSVVLPTRTVLVMGGETSEGFSNEVWKSVTGGVTWTLVTANAWSTGVSTYYLSISDISLYYLFI